MKKKMGLPAPGLQEAADSFARKAWRALARGTGMRLTALEVIALHEVESDGEWRQSFHPLAAKAIDTRSAETENTGSARQGESAVPKGFAK